jgi:hypothetical protein
MNEQKRFAVHRATGKDIRPKQHDRYELRHYYGRGYNVEFTGTRSECWREKGKMHKNNPYNFPDKKALRVEAVI